MDPADPAGALLAQLEDLDVALSVQGGALGYDAPPGVLTSDLLDRVRAHRDELVTLLAPSPEVAESGPTGSGQQRLHAFTTTTDEPSTYTIAVRWALSGPLDRGALEAAVDDLRTRHPALRTRYRRSGAGLRQDVLVPRWSALTVERVDTPRLEAALLRCARAPFDLEAEPAFRCVLFDVGPERAELLVALHHGIGDGWSVSVLVRDLAELYRARVTAEPARLPAPGLTMVEFAREERRRCRDPRTRVALRAWVEGLGPGLDLPVLPTDRPRSAQRGHAGAVHRRTIAPDLVTRLGLTARRRSSTPFALVVAAFARLQHELTGAATAAIGCPVANRADPRAADVVGLFSHAGWLVVPQVATAGLEELIARSGAAVRHRLARQAVPADLVERELGAPFDRAPGRVQLSLYNDALPDLHLVGLRPAPTVVVPMTGARVEQGWLLAPTADGGLQLDVEYAVELFDESTVRAAADRWIALLQAVADDRDPRTTD